MNRATVGDHLIVAPSTLEVHQSVSGPGGFRVSGFRTPSTSRKTLAGIQRHIRRSAGIGGAQRKRRRYAESGRDGRAVDLAGRIYPWTRQQLSDLHLRGDWRRAPGSRRWRIVMSAWTRTKAANRRRARLTSSVTGSSTGHRSAPPVAVSSAGHRLRAGMRSGSARMGTLCAPTASTWPTTPETSRLPPGLGQGSTPL
jgi:hypothetical protein